MANLNVSVTSSTGQTSNANIETNDPDLLKRAHFLLNHALTQATTPAPPAPPATPTA